MLSTRLAIFLIWIFGDRMTIAFNSGWIAILGFVFLPQLLGLALAGLSLVRREPGGRRPALLAVAISLLLTVVWGIVLGLLLKWWATSR